MKADMSEKKDGRNLFSWKYVWVGLLAIVACVYATSLTVPFHFDDEHTIRMNESVHHLSNLFRLWTDVTTSSYLPDNRSYRPLKYTFDVLWWTLAGGAPWPFHVWKIFMHSVVCLCLFLIWRRLWKEPGWFPVGEKAPSFLKPERVALLLAVLFAVHPAMTEIVTYMSASSSLQCSMFYLLAYVAFLKWRDDRRPLWTVLAIVSYAASCMSKEEGITLPAVLFLTVFFLEKGRFDRRFGQAIKETWAYWAAFVAILSFTYQMIPESNAKSRGNVPPIEYFMTQWRAWLWYMRLWFWPWDLNADNVEFGFSNSLFDPRVIQAFIGNALLLIAAFAYRKRFPAFLFGLLWFYITISPASSLLPLAEPVNEHRMYLSYIGFVGGVACFFVWMLFEALTPKPTARQAAMAYGVIAVALAIGTLNRITVWQTPANLWADTVEKNPSSGRAQNNLALIFMEKGEFAKALEHLDACERNWPNYMYCALNKGIVGLAQGNADLAEKSLARAATLDPESPWVNFQLGRLYHDIKHDPRTALTYFAKSDSLTGNRYIEAKEWIARIQLEAGNKDQARSLASEILKEQPQRRSALELLNRASQ